MTGRQVDTAHPPHAPAPDQSPVDALVLGEGYFDGPGDDLSRAEAETVRGQAEPMLEESTFYPETEEEAIAKAEEVRRQAELMREAPTEDYMTREELEAELEELRRQGEELLGEARRVAELMCDEAIVDYEEAETEAALEAARLAREETERELNYHIGVLCETEACEPVGWEKMRAVADKATRLDQGARKASPHTRQMIYHSAQRAHTSIRRALRRRANR